MGKVTILGIAEALGLSRNTVSLALKGSPAVSARTREQVRDYAKSVHFPGLPEETSDQTQRRLLVVRNEDSAPYWDMVIGGVSAEASLHNCLVQVAVVTQEAEAKGKLPAGLDETISAVLFVSPLAYDYVRRVCEMGVPVFLLDDFAESREKLWDSVMAEGYRPMRQLVGHLFEGGLQKFAFVSASSHTLSSMQTRYLGFLRGLEDHSLEERPEWVIPEAEDPFHEPMYRELVNRWQQIGMPEAVLCGNDAMARLMTLALREAGLRVPEDVKVTGFDNEEENQLDPFFTTVSVNAKWLGRRLVRCFLERLRQPDAPFETVRVTGKMIYRHSTESEA